jgi:hypothetical protein
VLFCCYMLCYDIACCGDLADGLGQARLQPRVRLGKIGSMFMLLLYALLYHCCAEEHWQTAWAKRGFRLVSGEAELCRCYKCCCYILCYDVMLRM